MNYFYYDDNDTKMAEKIKKLNPKDFLMRFKKVDKKKEEVLQQSSSKMPSFVVEDKSVNLTRRSSDIEFEEILNDEAAIKNYVIIEPEPQSSLYVITHPIFGDITKSSACKQFVVGGAFGWTAGSLAVQFGKTAAISVGGILLLIQIAQYKGYISIDWTKAYHALTRAEARLRYAMLKHSDSTIQKFKTFYDENFFLATGFMTGCYAAIVLS